MTTRIGNLSIMEDYCHPPNGDRGTAIWNFATQQLLFLRGEDLDDLYNYISLKLSNEETGCK